MKKLKEVVEVENEGLVSLLGQRVTLMCGVYTYTGKLEGVNDTCVLLSDCGIVFETGSYTDNTWKDYQEFPGNIYVVTSNIEAFGVIK